MAMVTFIRYQQCMRYAKTKEEFIDRVEAMGYGVCWTDSRKYITYTIPQGMKCRDNRLHHEGYTKAAMEQEVALRRVYLWSYGLGGDLLHRHLTVHRTKGAV